ncbi:uncharacterized protein LOC121988583 [Zingiber officinale]|uniref:Uncharacterized protein n=1 Tax=Zingiber officinale TaxID=94328 RepID=A0A8J5G2Y4_ZINOF|nr:uncharacterized protein LOC121988583 [Zingiber officinale]KAG6497009.1 hypothetical protein ZIOFF_044893 [Zingiber officinale]
MASPTLKAKDESMLGTKQFHQQKKRITTQTQSSKSPSKPSPSRIKNVDFSEKVGALKTEKLPRQTAKDREGIKKNSVMSPLCTPQKPWPGRKVIEMDEPVKNMSNVPLYLRRLEKHDSIHEKALNVGVLEWGLLEKWTHEKCATDGTGGDCASSCTESSTLSTFGFSNQSCGTTASPFYQGKKSSVLAHKKMSFSGSPTMTQKKVVNRLEEGISDSRISSIMLPSVDFNPLDLQNDKDMGTCLDFASVSGEVHLESQSTTSPSRINTDHATTIRLGEEHDCILTEAGKFADFTNVIPFTKNTRPPFHNNGGISSFLQPSADSGQLSSGSTITTDYWQSESYDKSHSGDVVEDFEIMDKFSKVPHSCPLPLAILNDEPDIPCNVPLVETTPIDKSVRGNGGIDVCPSGSCEKLESNATQKSRKFEAKATSSAGKKSTIHPSSVRPTRMSKSSSSKGGSSEELFESISLLYNSHGEQVTRNSKGRQSPLRRLLDPIMKPKNNLHSTGKVAALPGQHSGELRADKSSPGLNKQSKTNVNSVSQTRDSIITSKELPNDGIGTQTDKNHATNMKQALLQLAWKNGLPLFMLSSGDGEVLAAAIAGSSAPHIDNLECMFHIFSINGSKKKNTFWSSSVNKDKQHQLISNVVGQLNVALGEVKSFRHGSFDYVREFILHDAYKSFDSSTASELAAIVVPTPPFRKPNSRTQAYFCNYGGSLLTNSAGNSRTSPGEKNLHSYQHNGKGHSGISVIIPSGIHGLANDGEPSTLIERWRSGGDCDCGGWDEGCALTILSNKFQAHNSCGSFQPYQTADDTCRFELFTQGASQETRHAFSMISFKEGLYTVDFQASISLLQAFAICLAVIHGKKPYDHSTLRKNLQEHIVNDGSGQASTTRGDPNSHVRNHPPVSPLRRT